jgi:hypothetical protein
VYKTEADGLDTRQRHVFNLAAQSAGNIEPESLGPPPQKQRIYKRNNQLRNITPLTHRVVPFNRLQKSKTTSDCASLPDLRDMAIHAAVPRPETPEPSERPSGLPRACSPRNDGFVMFWTFPVSSPHTPAIARNEATRQLPPPVIARSA